MPMVGLSSQFSALCSAKCWHLALISHQRCRIWLLLLLKRFIGEFYGHWIIFTEYLWFRSVLFAVWLNSRVCTRPAGGLSKDCILIRNPYEEVGVIFQRVGQKQRSREWLGWSCSNTSWMRTEAQSSGQFLGVSNIFLPTGLVSMWRRGPRSCHITPAPGNCYSMEIFQHAFVLGPT